jgi:hypothetical protein
MTHAYDPRRLTIIQSPRRGGTVARAMTRLEGLDDEHAAAAVRAGMIELV